MKLTGQKTRSVFDRCSVVYALCAVSERGREDLVPATERRALRQREALALVAAWRVAASDAEEAVRLFRRYADQRFSLTDCTSFALMQRHSLKEAFTFDSHFETLGFLPFPRV